jgi:hypothetical protein
VEFITPLVQIVVNLWTLVVGLLSLGVHWFALIVWVAWWLWGVNWKKMWPVLAGGAWVPLVLLMILGALAWSRMDPTDCTCLGIVTLPNFWWQFVGVTMLTGLAFFCGWLQEIFGWTPAEINLEPPAISTHGQEHAAHH